MKVFSATVIPGQLRGLAIWLLALLALPTGASPLPDTLDRVRPGVVAIGTVNQIKGTRRVGPPVTFLGSGFVVGDGQWVVTNLHVLPSDPQADAMATLSVFAGRGEAGRATPAEIVATDAQHDLALLRLDSHLPPLHLAGPELIREGTQVAFTGFPIGMVLGLYPATHQGIVAAVTPFAIPSHNSATLTAAQIKRLRRPFEVYQLDAIAHPGHSGSPVYDPRSGKVVGVMNSVFVRGSKEHILSNPSAIAYVIPVRHVHQLLQGRN